MKKAVVIIPTYNERGNIARVIEALSDVFVQIKNWDLHILVVDDTSPDKTYEVVESLSEKNKKIHLLINQQKAGLGAAYLKGMAEAFGDLKADVIFEFDADLSHDPTKLPLFLAAIENGADMVIGSRYIPGGGIPDDWGFHRKFLSVVGNSVLMAILTNISIHDWTSGYRAITKKVYDAVHPDLTNERFYGYTFQIAFLHQAVRRKFRITEVPFKFIDRTEGKSKLGSEYIVNNLLYLFRTRIKEVISNRVFKFAAVGGTGAAVQLSSLVLWRALFPFQVATFMSIETAVLSNFILNNFWTFSDRKLDANSLPFKFVQFNLASTGSIVIQQLVALFGEFVWPGLMPLFTIPVINFKIDTGLILAMVGIVIGMFWNFFAYSKFIWKKPS